MVKDLQNNNPNDLAKLKKGGTFEVVLNNNTIKTITVQLNEVISEVNNYTSTNLPDGFYVVTDKRIAPKILFQQNKINDDDLSKYKTLPDGYYEVANGKIVEVLNSLFDLAPDNPYIYIYELDEEDKITEDGTCKVKIDNKMKKFALLFQLKARL